MNNLDQIEIIMLKLIIKIFNRVKLILFIKLNFINIIILGMEHNFDKYNNTQVNTLNTSYDYASVMHYERDAFSSNGRPTIEPLQPNVEIGQRYNMSTTDIEEVRIFYNCSSSGGTLPPIPTTTTG